MGHGHERSSAELIRLAEEKAKKKRARKNGMFKIAKGNAKESRKLRKVIGRGLRS